MDDPRRDDAASRDPRVRREAARPESAGSQSARSEGVRAPRGRSPRGAYRWGGVPGEAGAVTPKPAVARAHTDTTPGAHRPLVHAQLPRASLDTLPVPGLTRRRLAVLVAGVVAIWLVGVFARQVGDASAASAQVDQMRQRNAAVAGQIIALEKEIQLAQEQSFIEQAAHGYGLGGPREIAFVVDPNAAALPANAPGAVGIRDAVPEPHKSPLETWLRVLFGPGSN